MKSLVRVFIGSSSEGLEVKDALELRLTKRSCDVVAWDGIFDLSEGFMETLEGALELAEFAILVLTPDDVREKRGTDGRVPRDNVVFELGLFMGRLGRGRTFAVRHPEAELPTDLSGISVVEYDPDLMEKDPDKAIRPVATEILQAIKKVPAVAKSVGDDGSGHLLADWEAIFNEIVSWPANDCEIAALTPTTDWAWRVIPTLLYWRLNGARVRVLAPPVTLRSRERKEKAMRGLLADLGVDFQEKAKIPVSGFFLKTPYRDEDCAVVLDEDKESQFAVRYTGKVDTSAVEALHGLLPAGTGSATAFTPSLVRQGSDELLARLRNVKQYASPTTMIDMISAKTDELWVMSPYARSYKYEQTKRLCELYEQAGEEPFSALAIQLRSGDTSIVTPPVVEEVDGRRVVIEGTTRATYCHRESLGEYHCVRVRKPAEDLPGQPIPIDDIEISKRSADEKRDPRYRHIERAVHPY